MEREASIIPNTIYNEPCEATLKRLPSDFIDLTVTSPPYDNVRSYKGFSFDLDTIIPELLRVTKPGGVVVWVVGDQTRKYCESGTSFRHALAFMAAGWKLHDTMIYVKKPRGLQMGGGKLYEQAFEYMFVFCKGDSGPKTVNRIKDRVNTCHGEKFHKNLAGRNQDGTLKQVKERDGIYEPFGYRTNVWTYSTGFGKTTSDKIAFKHPALMPEALARDHILSWSNKGDLVYDPFSGAGTTAKMALLSGRNFLASELSAEYCNIAQARLRMYGWSGSVTASQVNEQEMPEPSTTAKLPELVQGRLFDAAGNPLVRQLNPGAQNTGRQVATG